MKGAIEEGQPVRAQLPCGWAGASPDCGRLNGAETFSEAALNGLESDPTTNKNETTVSNKQQQQCDRLVSGVWRAGRSPRSFVLRASVAL